MPDSVRSRHISIPVLSAENSKSVNNFLDSLKHLIQDEKITFEEAALKYSKDGSSRMGGDLGWRAMDGSFVSAFEEHLFFTGEKDSLAIVYT